MPRVSPRHPLKLAAVDRFADSLFRSTGWALLRYDASGELLVAGGPKTGHADATPDTTRVDVLVHGEPVGSLGLGQPRDAAPTQKPPVEVLASFAEILGSWVAALRQARDNDDELSTLIEITRLLTSTVELPRVLAVACEAAVRTVEANAAILWLLDTPKLHLVAKAQFHLSDDLLEAHERPLSSSLVDQEALAGDPVIINSVANDERCHDWPEAIRRREHSALCVGLVGRSAPIGVLHVLADPGTEFTIHSTRLLMAIAGQLAACIEQSMLEKERQARRRLSREFAAASVIQSALLPRSIPRPPGIDIAVHFEPRHDIGGDLYDFIAFREDNLGVAIGDASGKSITGALMMATVRGGLHAYVEDHYHISDILRRLNRAIHDATYGEYFMTLFYGVLNLRTRVFTFTNSGHNPPIWRRQGAVTELVGGGTILGADPQSEYPVSTINLSVGDSLVLYTDGLSESLNEAGEQFGPARIQAAAIGAAAGSAQDILDAILNQAIDFRGDIDPHDDLTLLILKVTGPPATSPAKPGTS